MDVLDCGESLIEGRGRKVSGPLREVEGHGLFGSWKEWKLVGSAEFHKVLPSPLVSPAGVFREGAFVVADRLFHEILQFRITGGTSRLVAGGNGSRGAFRVGHVQSVSVSHKETYRNRISSYGDGPQGFS